LQECIEFIRASLQQDFVQESILVVMSVVFGGLITVIINNVSVKNFTHITVPAKMRQ
jgi:uncharacterized protein YegL